MPRVIVELECPVCGKPLSMTTSLFDSRRMRCPQCGTIIVAKVNVVIEYERFDDNMLKEFEKWLIENKNVMPDTARRYAKDVKKWLIEGKWPRGYTAPIMYWNEWKEEKARRPGPPGGGVTEYQSTDR